MNTTNAVSELSYYSNPKALFYNLSYTSWVEINLDFRKIEHIDIFNIENNLMSDYNTGISKICQNLNLYAWFNFKSLFTRFTMVLLIFKLPKLLNILILLYSRCITKTCNDNKMHCRVLRNPKKLDFPDINVFTYLNDNSYSWIVAKQQFSIMYI